MLAIDPEDLNAQYSLMLCYKGLGDEKNAHAHEVRYLRFKANEAAQAITGPYRREHPFDNNERQAIHEHLSVPLPALASGYAEKLDKPDVGPGYLPRLRSVHHKRRNLAYSKASRAFRGIQVMQKITNCLLALLLLVRCSFVAANPFS